MSLSGTSGWMRPESESVIGFAIFFLLFTLAGYVVHAHIRAGTVHWLKTGIVGLFFTIAILYGFAVGLWVVDRVGIYAPYAVAPQPVIERHRSDGGPPPSSTPVS